jgi:hypothetical protein
MAIDAMNPDEEPIPAPAPESKPEITPEEVFRLSWLLSEWPVKPPSPAALAHTIRRLSEDGCISYLDHGGFRLETRFKEMGRDVFDMYDVLEKGRIDGPIKAGKTAGEWKVKMVGTLDGTSRKMGVVVFIVLEQEILIQTVEWEDR